MAKSLKDASKKSIYKSNVSRLDSLGINKEELLQDVAYSALEKACGEFILRVIENINKRRDFVSTGSITDITLEPTENGIKIMAPSHLIYQSRGVSGTEKKYNTPHSFTNKMPPADVFIDWVKGKAIRLKDNEKYSRKKPPFKGADPNDDLERMAWAISRSIYKKGIAPKNLYENEIPKLLEDIQREVLDFMIQHFEQIIPINPIQGGDNRIITIK